MTLKDVYVMTEKGLEEIRTRRDGIPQELRVLFFMLDGRSTSGHILEQLNGFGIQPDVFDQLLAGGYIALVRAAGSKEEAGPAGAGSAKHMSPAELADEDRFAIARQYMNETAVNAAGLRSFLFTLRLERCTTMEDLKDMIPDYSKFIQKGSGKFEAEVLIRRARELTSPGPKPARKN